MYSNLTLYYLNQMQIRPWIKRDSFLLLDHPKDSLQQEAIKLIVFISSHMSLKAKSLVQQMLAYLSLSDDELRIIPIQNKELLTDYQFSIAQQIPLAILVMGLNGNLLKESLNFGCPVLKSTDPEYLIANPSEKRKMFEDLHALKKVLF